MKKSRLLGAVCALLIGLISPADLLAENGYTIIDLGSLGGGYSDATSINSSRQVTGKSFPSRDSTRRHAFLF